MKKCCALTTVLMLIIGGLIGAGVMYQYGKCKTQTKQVDIQFGTKSEPGLTITRSGNQ